MVAILSRPQCVHLSRQVITRLGFHRRYIRILFNRYETEYKYVFDFKDLAMRLMKLVNYRGLIQQRDRRTLWTISIYINNIFHIV